MARAIDVTAIIAGITIETDGAGLVFCAPAELAVQYDGDEDFRRYFDSELEGLYLLDDELGHCEAGDHLVPDDELVPVEVMAATRLSPAEHDPVCVGCLERQADEPDHDPTDPRI